MQLSFRDGSGSAVKLRVEVKIDVLVQRRGHGTRRSLQELACVCAVVGRTEWFLDVTAAIVPLHGAAALAHIWRFLCCLFHSLKS